MALVAGDLLAIFAAHAIASSAGAGWPLVYSPPALWSPGAALTAVVWVGVLWRFGLYRRRIDLAVVATWPTIALGASVATMLMMLLGAVLGEQSVFPAPLGYDAIAVAWAISLITLPSVRVWVRYVQKSVRRRGVSEKRTLIIGSGQVATLLAEKMLRSPELGLCPVAFWDREPPDSSRRDSLALPVYRREADLEDIIAKECINHVLVAFSAASFNEIVSYIERCCEHAVEITVVPRLFEITAVNPQMDEIEGVPIVRIHRRGMGHAGALTKRVFDVVLTTIVLTLIAPILLGVAIAVLAESGSPVLFRQTRIGKDRAPFTMYKFRSMVTTAEQDKATLFDCNELSGPLFKMHDDPRVTRVGRWIRRYSLDELPQLFNVLKGDMSLVGPRPPLPDEVEQYSEWHLKRLAITPGITGLWQILGRTELTFDEMVSLDLNYSWNWSVWLDFSILARTLGAVLHGKGAS